MKQKGLEARVGIEPTHKGFAVLTSTRNPLIKQGVSVGSWLPKGVVLAPFGTLLATLMATTLTRPHFLKKRSLAAESFPVFAASRRTMGSLSPKRTS
jgi:hypothetical protein